MKPMTSFKPLYTTLYGVIILPVITHNKVLNYPGDFNATCYSVRHGFGMGTEEYYDNFTLSDELFDTDFFDDGITINGDDYFFLELNFDSPINLDSIKLYWRPVNARALDSNQNQLIFTDIKYHDLFNDTLNIIPHTQGVWDDYWPMSDYVLFDGDITSDLVFTDQVIVRLTFQDTSISSIHITNCVVTGDYYTWDPSPSPTKSPSTEPTPFPSPSPTGRPTPSPSSSPSESPSPAPTEVPTLKVHDHATNRDEYEIEDINDTNSSNSTTIWRPISYEKWSTNIYPLSLRNESLYSFTVPTDKNKTEPYCLTCILAWPEIDATIQVQGCDDHLPNNTIPNAFYDCDDGVWILTTSASLAQFQQTYGRIEIWELDANELVYLQWRFEFQWNTSQCIWFDNTTQSHEPCDLHLLPLTASDKNTVMFQWTMPKTYADNRNAPLVVVWYDLLSIPYSIRPTLEYTPRNLTLIDVGRGTEFGVEDIWTNFKDAFIGIGIILGAFVVASSIGCCVAKEKQSKQELLLKTYNLRTAYRQDRENEIVPEMHAMKDNKFSCQRHGPWLIIVLVGRIVYMMVFTTVFFGLAFQTLNGKWFEILDRYEEFASNRTGELTAVFSRVAAHYRS